jgi:hypothetical protein
MEDWELWVHAAERGWRFHHLPYVTFDYRVRPDSLIFKCQSPQVLQDFQKRVLLKHPRLHVDLLSFKLAAEQERSRILSDIVEQTKDLGSRLAAEQEEVRVLSAQLAAEHKYVEVLLATLEQVKHQVLERDRTIQSLRTHAAASEQNQKALSGEVASLDAELSRIKGARGWRLLQSYGRIKYRHLLPVYRFLALMRNERRASASSSPKDEKKK